MTDRAVPEGSSGRQRPPAAAATTAGSRPLKVLRRRSRRDQPQEVEHPARWTRPHVRTLAVASGKGGVGKSNLAANLAVALGQRGARVVLLDADLAQANLDLLLGVHPRFDVQHVLSGEKALGEIVVDGPCGVKLIPAASGVPDLAELDDYRRECLLRGLSTLDLEMDLILIDIASGVSRQVTSFCLAADEVLIVTTPEMPAFSDAYGFIKLLKQHGLVRPPHLMVNMADTPEEAEETTHRIRLVARRFLQRELDAWGYVPFDPLIARAVRLQEPVVTAFPNSPAAVAYRALADLVWEEFEPDPPQQRNRPAAPEKLEA
jgi:flagellar biosynthesis protein FlhG